MENNYLIPQDELENYLGIFEDESSEVSYKITPGDDEEDKDQFEDEIRVNNYFSGYRGDKNQRGDDNKQINYSHPPNYGLPSNYDKPNEISLTGYNIKTNSTNYNQPESSNYLIGDDNNNYTENYKDIKENEKEEEIKYTIPNTSNYDNPEDTIKGYNPTGESIKEENKYSIPGYTEEKKYTTKNTEENQYLIENTSNYDNPEDTIKENKNEETEKDPQVNSSNLAKLLKAIKWSKTSKVIPKPPEWNEKFQELMSLENSYEKYDGLRNLAQDFVYCAETYGRIIISEKCLPNEKKTIKPVGIGGIAGGEKYIIQGILFKFAIDFEGIYGGDEGAMKAAGHELNGLMTYFNQNIEGLHVPLMALIDYRGYRVTAISLLPIGKDTIVYGSFDAGNTVYDSEPKVNEMMEKLGKKMNIKGHIVGGKKKVLIYGPADIEVHKGKGEDERFYVLDFARYMPPQTPKKSQWQKTLYQLLRPEFVQKWKTPLSPDAYSRMGIHDNKVHKAEVKEAFKHLLIEIIPSLAQSLDERFEKEHKNDPSEFILVFHEVGVNMRQIGRVRFNSKNETIKKLLMVEALARTMKSHLRALYREKMSQLTVPNEEVFREITISFMNLIFGNINQTKSEQYWNGVLKEKLVEKFEKILSPGEMEPNFQIRTLVDDLDMLVLLKRFIKMMNIKLSKGCSDLFFHSGAQLSTILFLVTDIVSVDTKVKHLNLIDYASGMSLVYKIKEMKNYDTTNRILNTAQELLTNAQKSTSGHIETTFQLANVFQLMIDVEQQFSLKTELYQRAKTIYKSNIKSLPEHKMSWIRLGDLELCMAYYEKAEKRYKEIFSSLPEDIDCLYSLANFYYQRLRAFYERSINHGVSDVELVKSCEEMLEKCISLSLNDVQSTSKSYYLYGLLMNLILRHKRKALDTHYGINEYSSEDRELFYIKKSAKFYNVAAEATPYLIPQILQNYPFENKEIVYLSSLMSNGFNQIVSHCKKIAKTIDDLKLFSIDNLGLEREKRIFNDIFLYCARLEHLNLKGTIVSTQIIPSLLNMVNNNSSSLKSVHLPLILFEEGFDFDQFFEKFPHFPGLEEFGLCNFSSMKDSSFKIISKTIPNLKSLDLGYCRSLGLESLEILKEFKELKKLDICGCDQINIENLLKIISENKIGHLDLSSNKNLTFDMIKQFLKAENSLEYLSFKDCNLIDPYDILHLPISTCNFLNTNGYYIPFSLKELSFLSSITDTYKVGNNDFTMYIIKPKMINKLFWCKYQFVAQINVDGENKNWEYCSIERMESNHSIKLNLGNKTVFNQVGIKTNGIFNICGRTFSFSSPNSNLPLMAYVIDLFFFFSFFFLTNFVKRKLLEG
eukprot:TRINITY_DN2050_c0_g2_i9.p1 TRINITY_DN2050_c0_g2~~TRINITY_DN2050_c0_g2_i9.p1  ORF type:complete len:1349 (-),score=401.15 TRINITY_DN2050_c0_g2_i9:136-4182(-)